MKNEIIQLNRYATKENTIQSFVCFRKFINFLKDQVETENRSRKHFYNFILDRISLEPALLQDGVISGIENYHQILDLVAAIIFPLGDDKAMVGLTSATSPDVFYATDAFYHLFKPVNGRPAPQSWIDENSLKEIHKQFQYNLALNKIYGYALPEKMEMIHSLFNQETGLFQYFRIIMDARFVEVKIKPGHKKKCDRLVNSCIVSSNPLAKIEDLLSLDNFSASGFSIITINDVTEQQAAEQIGKELNKVEIDNTEIIFSNIGGLLQTILGSKDFRFGMMPFFIINKRSALPYENFKYSIIADTCFKAGVSREDFNTHMNDYIKTPRWVIYNSTNKNVELPASLQNAFKSQGLHYYVTAPVFFNNELVGILEIVATNGTKELDDLQFSKLRPAMVFIAQLMKLFIERFNSSIDAIIRDKFTNIQPSIQWKFKEVAWHYFRSREIEGKDDSIEHIFFKAVYPFYGAVDIRNSTVERNRALREDLKFQVHLLIDLLISLYENSFGNNYLNLANTCNDWLVRIDTLFTDEEELELDNFLLTLVQPSLRVEHLPDLLNKKVNDYFESVNEQTGQCFFKRRQIENSIRMLNNLIGKYFELFHEELQVNYPCYFEKFRTDGVEYDIYIGQSISPSMPFSIQHLDKLRLWQLKSMAAVTKLTHFIQPQLEYPLQTTQLIYVNGRAIDISFRNDERRFDVEGAYNIRYQIVKKRIDKVHIRNTNERLTQPGKIAIVYFNEKDITTYIEEITRLQQQHILMNDLEMLHLEDLQGVAGLKALRVGICLE